MGFTHDAIEYTRKNNFVSILYFYFQTYCNFSLVLSFKTNRYQIPAINAEDHNLKVLNLLCEYSSEYIVFFWRSKNNDKLIVASRFIRYQLRMIIYQKIFIMPLKTFILQPFWNLILLVINIQALSR